MKVELQDAESGDMTNRYVFGRPPAKQIQVNLSPAEDPKDMVKGMEEYFFKEVQAMSFGKSKPVQENLYLAVL